MVARRLTRPVVALTWAAARVAAGALGRRLLDEFDITIVGHVVNLGGIAVSGERPPLDELERIAEESPLRCFDKEAEARMIAKIDQARKNGDSLGGVFAPPR